jgi:hypothetical protein
MGGEYEKLHGFFQKVGITHHVSCPDAHQQMIRLSVDIAIYIVEVGLALLVDAYMFLKFWDKAFLKATFLINLLPTKVLHFQRPTQKILNVTPN